MSARSSNVVVVGAGAMGSQIGMLCALAGYSATITDIAQDALDRAETELRQRMTRDVEKDRRTAGRCRRPRSVG